MLLDLSLQQEAQPAAPPAATAILQQLLTEYGDELRNLSLPLSPMITALLISFIKYSRILSKEELIGVLKVRHFWGVVCGLANCYDLLW